MSNPIVFNEGTPSLPKYLLFSFFEKTTLSKYILKILIFMVYNWYHWIDRWIYIIFIIKLFGDTMLIIFFTNMVRLKKSLTSTSPIATPFMGRSSIFHLNLFRFPCNSTFPSTTFGKHSTSFLRVFSKRYLWIFQVKNDHQISLVNLLVDLAV